MQIERSPFLKLDKSSVIGYLKSTGSRDPDIIHTQKANLVSLAKFPKYVGVYVMVLGAMLTITILMSFIGIPMLILGWWMRGRGVQNLKVVEQGYSEYSALPRAA